MKTHWLILFCFLAVPVVGLGQKKAEKQLRLQQQYEELKQLINSENYCFEATRAIPTEFRTTEILSAPNTLKVIDSLAVSELPFFGRAYYVEYGSTEGGIRFNGAYSDYSVKFNDKKRSVEIAFKVKGTNDMFQVRIDAFGKNDCTVNITSNNRSFISYQGFIGPIKEE